MLDLLFDDSDQQTTSRVKQCETTGFVLDALESHWKRGGTYLYVWSVNLFRLVALASGHLIPIYRVGCLGHIGLDGSRVGTPALYLSVVSVSVRFQRDISFS